jgi:hypothetical protein
MRKKHLVNRLQQAGTDLPMYQYCSIDDHPSDFVFGHLFASLGALGVFARVQACMPNKGNTGTASTTINNP